MVRYDRIVGADPTYGRTVRNMHRLDAAGHATSATLAMQRLHVSGERSSLGPAPMTNTR